MPEPAQPTQPGPVSTQEQQHKNHQESPCPWCCPWKNSWIILQHKNHQQSLSVHGAVHGKFLNYPSPLFYPWNFSPLTSQGFCWWFPPKKPPRAEIMIPYWPKPPGFKESIEPQLKDKAKWSSGMTLRRGTGNGEFRALGISVLGAVSILDVWCNTHIFIFIFIYINQNLLFDASALRALLIQHCLWHQSVLCQENVVCVLISRGVQMWGCRRDKPQSSPSPRPTPFLQKDFGFLSGPFNCCENKRI